MPLTTAFVLLAVAGLLLGAASVLALRWAQARPGIGRRLAGPPEVKVGQLLGDGVLPARAVRVSGRIRCREPLDAGDGELLVAFHRDVEVRSRGRWRSVERLRETRSFELWDHDGSLQLDPAEAAEPLVVLPHVWAGPADELDESYAGALARVTAEQGPPTRARAATRMVSIVDRLLVLASITRDATGGIALAPPRGGYLVSSLELDDAMRLLGGPRPRLLLAGTAAIWVGAALVAAALLALLVSLVTG